MKKIVLILLLFITVSFSGNAQEDLNVFSTGISGGIDYNMNAYQLTNNTTYGNSYYGVSPRYNLGVDFGYMVTKKFRPRLEFKYVSVRYGLDFTPSPVYSNCGKDLVILNYFNLNLHFDYSLLTIKKFQLFASPALKYEFLLNAIPAINWSGITVLEHPSNSIGGALSAIFKYNITEHIGITLTPEYTYFFNKFSSTNDKAFTRFSGNFGVEYKFGD
jgi:hypothetical protein